MKINQLALQLYTLRDFLKTPADMATTLKKARAIGYSAVQESGVGPVDVREWNAMLKGEGLVNCATHEDPKLILEHTDAAIQRLKERGVSHTAYPYPSVELKGLDDVKALAAKLDKAGALFRKAGCTLSYHNHQIEFRRFEGKPMLSWIYELTDPAHLKAEIDTYWVQAGGGDPVAWCQSLKNRLPLLHMKDFVIDAEGKAAFAEIGSGNLDFKAIVAAAEASGCEWYIVEQDSCPGDPFESVKKSYEYVKANLVKE